MEDATHDITEWQRGDKAIPSSWLRVGIIVHRKCYPAVFAAQRVDQLVGRSHHRRAECCHSRQLSDKSMPIG
jgi:hypothetical protein